MQSADNLELIAGPGKQPCGSLGARTRAENLSCESLQIFTLESLIVKSAKLLDGSTPGTQGAPTSSAQMGSSERKRVGRKPGRAPSCQVSERNPGARASLRKRQ